ncbi:hypothetical protein B0H34DRAFT_798537 [Crassisporium funariophilum]|nr:hypothetical protein B0H34DRAFT_798537 [Crassisporium funariophilum]
MSSDDDKERELAISDDELVSESDDEKGSILSKSDSSPTHSRSSSPDPSARSTDRFTQPPPSKLRRTALLFFVAILLWLAFFMRSKLLEAKRKPQVIHASRYSKEYKFRPAASPIITETLKDGRIRLRGALPNPPPTSTPPVPKKKKRTRTGKVSGKRNSGKTKPKASSGKERRM